MSSFLQSFWSSFFETIPEDITQPFKTIKVHDLRDWCKLVEMNEACHSKLLKFKNTMPKSQNYAIYRNGKVGVSNDYESCVVASKPYFVHFERVNQGLPIDAIIGLSDEHIEELISLSKLHSENCSIQLPELCIGYSR